MSLRDARADDAAAVLRLNQESVQYLSAMDAPRLALLASQARYFRVDEEDGRVQAFLLGFREGSAYDSPNYRWFATRYPRFLYIDRVVIDAPARGRGLGRRFYQDVFAHARAEGVPLVTCEIDSDPPNPVSHRFHAAWGFQEVGSQIYGVASKRVSLQVCPVGPPFATQALPARPTVQAPDGSDVRVLPALAGGGLAHFSLAPGQVAGAVMHRTVEEIWYVLSGGGTMWRSQHGVSAFTPLVPGQSLTLPLGTQFQFRADAHQPLAVVAVTMPPWPGEGEAVPVTGPWEPTAPAAPGPAA